MVRSRTSRYWSIASEYPARWNDVTNLLPRTDDTRQAWLTMSCRPMIVAHLSDGLKVTGTAFVVCKDSPSMNARSHFLAPEPGDDFRVTAARDFVIDTDRVPGVSIHDDRALDVERDGHVEVREAAKIFDHDDECATESATDFDIRIRIFFSERCVSISRTVSDIARTKCRVRTRDKVDPGIRGEFHRSGPTSAEAPPSGTFHYAGRAEVRFEATGIAPSTSPISRGWTSPATTSFQRMSASDRISNRAENARQNLLAA